MALLYHNKRLQGTTTKDIWTAADEQLYHNKRLQGTTTRNPRRFVIPILYHNKRLQGTTTDYLRYPRLQRLYHNKRLQGTTTTTPERALAGILYHNKRLQGTTTMLMRSSLVIQLYHNKRLQGTTTPDLLDNLIDVCFPTYRGQTWKPVIRQSHLPGKSPGYPCSERGVENGIQKVERTAIRQIGPCFRPGSPCLEVERHGGAL